MAKDRFKKSMTAAEAMEKLRSDPEWVARERAEEKWRQARARRLSELERSLVADLAAAGVDVQSVWDIVNSRGKPYPTAAIPVLLEHLKNADYDPAIRDGIARALTVRHPLVKAAIPELLEAFRRDPDLGLNGPKGAIGNVLDHVYDDRYVEEITRLALDRSHGPARSWLAGALAKSESDVAAAALRKLTSDPEPAVANVAKTSLARWEKKAQKRRSPTARR